MEIMEKLEFLLGYKWGWYERVVAKSLLQWLVVYEVRCCSEVVWVRFPWGPCEHYCNMSDLVLLVSYHRQEICSNQPAPSYNLRQVWSSYYCYHTHLPPFIFGDFYYSSGRGWLFSIFRLCRRIDPA
jgi:hypothetical protein